MVIEGIDYDPSNQEEHQALLLLGSPKAVAWEWIGRYAENLSRGGDPDDEWDFGGTISREELIETGMNVAAGEYDYISKGGLLEGVSLDPRFWDHLARLMGKEIPESNRNSFFSCSC